MAQTPRIFGAHLSVAGGLHLAIAEARRIKADCVQIFVKNQRQWAARPLDPAQIEALRLAAADARVSPIVAHASYLLNLATPDETIRERSKAALIDELLRCHALGIDALVFHPGAAMGDSESAAVARVADALNHVLETAGDGPTRILVECTAGQGTTIGHRFEHLGGILVGVRYPKRLGVCLDTCHLFAAGHDFRTAEGYAAMMGSLDREVGLDRVHCVHTNDSKGALGSRVDRHAHIGEGQIGPAGFAHLLADDRLAKVPFILETEHGEDENGRDLNEVNLERLRSLAPGQPRA